MFHPYLLGLIGTNRARQIRKNLLDHPRLVQESLGDKCLGRELGRLLVGNIDHNHDWVRGVPGKQLMDLRVVILVRSPSDIPAQKLFLNVDFSEHLVHLLVVDMIHKPDPILLITLVEGKGVGVGQLVDPIDILS